MCIYLFIYFINENVEEPLGGAVSLFFLGGFLELNQNENPAV